MPILYYQLSTCTCACTLPHSTLPYTLPHLVRLCFALEWGLPMTNLYQHIPQNLTSAERLNQSFVLAPAVDTQILFA